MAEAAGLYYEEHGAADAPVLILSAGLGGSGGYWSPNIPALAEYYRVIAYDHRGTARSERVCAQGLTLADLGADMLALMDALGIERASLMGHAIGGMAALEAARAAPDRIERVVVVNGWASLDPQTARCFSARLAVLDGGGPRAYLEAQPIFLFPATWLSEHDAAFQAETEHHLASWPGEGTMRTRIAAARGFDCTGWAGDLTCPVLMVSAADDLLVPWTSSEKLKALIGANASHLHLPWGGHAVNLTDPAPFQSAVIDFLRS